MFGAGRISIQGQIKVKSFFRHGKLEGCWGHSVAATHFWAGTW